ncbi:beta-1,4-galactosyltransferase 1 [Plakobranchus ocellatus]|uniref:Beta-1,4-galactosyltransferase n=1 Tax=Plakobranchus ocellatus TaxID=259542 RepID=A0AAV4D017_9GAST|nr:beta-1,4-galactosyltransferase 1 [Plakobranchus ocellatus]
MRRRRIQALSLCRPCNFCGSCRTEVIAALCLIALAANYLIFIQFKTFKPWEYKAVASDGSETPQSNRVKNDSRIRDKVKNKDKVLKERNSTDNEAPVENNFPKQEVPVGRNVTENETPIAKGQVDKDMKDEEGGQEDSKETTEHPANKTVLCPEKPAELVGFVNTNLTDVSLSTVEAKYPAIQKGGNYQPNDCQAREKLALILPCRNRTAHLNILLNNLLKILIKQKLDFTVFVIDQEFPTTFNRGMLFNVGYLEALKRDDYDCFIFHDVDMIPTNDFCLYKCTHNPRHFLSGVSKWHYGLPYKGYFGGVVAFTREQYQKINGDSNLYFGWGGEDDDLRARILNKGYSMLRYPKFIGRYDTMSHKRDSGNQANPARFTLVSKAKERQDEEGLNTTIYKVTEVVEAKLYTKIKVFINMTQVIQGAPVSVRNVVRVLLEDAKAFDAQMRMMGLRFQSSKQKDG